MHMRCSLRSCWRIQCIHVMSRAHFFLILGVTRLWSCTAVIIRNPCWKVYSLVFLVNGVPASTMWNDCCVVLIYYIRSSLFQSATVFHSMIRLSLMGTSNNYSYCYVTKNNHRHDNPWTSFWKTKKIKKIKTCTLLLQ
jgi:hypothetical protein